MLKKILFLFLCYTINVSFHAQVGINTSNPDPSSILHINSTDKGVILPTLTNDQRDALEDPAENLIIFNADENALQYNLRTPETPKWTTVKSNAKENPHGSFFYVATTPEDGQETLFTGTTADGDEPVVKKISLSTNAEDLVNFHAPLSNRLEYTGEFEHQFRVMSSISFSSSAKEIMWIFYIAKGNQSSPALPVNASKTYHFTDEKNEINAISVLGSLTLRQGDYIEVWAERYDGGGDNETRSIEVFSCNLVID